MIWATLALTDLPTSQPGRRPVQPVEVPAASPAPSPDIIVTAQKRPEAIQRVPVSIVALPSATLEARNAVSVTDLSRVAPGFAAIPSVASTALRLNIRGLGAFSNSATEPSVAVIVDGAYVPRAGSIMGPFLDVDQVEVLRGPQGTFFGRNATAGVLSISTASPRFQQDLQGSLEAGSFGRRKAWGVVNVPLGQAVAVRVAGQLEHRGGIWQNDYDGRSYGRSDSRFVRFGLKANLGQMSWTAKADHGSIRGDGAVAVDFDATSVSEPQLGRLRLLLGGALPDLNPDDRRINHNVTADLDDRQSGASSELNWGIGDLTLRLINSFRTWENRQLDGDAAFMPLPLLSRRSGARSDSQNHELQLQSPARRWLNGRLSLTAGLYYYRERYELEEIVQLNSAFCDTLVPAGPRPSCRAFLGATGGENATRQNVNQITRSLAAYGQGEFDLTERLSLVVGGRLSGDHKSGDYAQSVTDFNPVIAAVLAASLRAPEVLDLPPIHDRQLTYRVGLNFRPKSDVMIFASRSTGYKAGGYNSGGGTPALTIFRPDGSVVSTRRLFGPEQVLNMEAGIKSSWRQKALTANLVLYRMTINGFQDRSFDGVSFVIRNAGKLRQQGFEAEASFSPDPYLKFSGSLAYLDSRFLRFDDASALPGFGAGTTQDLRGRPATFSPRWQGNGAIDWEGRLGPGLKLSLSADVSFVSRQYVGLVTDANPQTLEKAHALVGARATIAGVANGWSLSIFGRNLSDTRTATGRNYQVLAGAFGLTNGVFPGSTAIRRLRGEPRSVGVGLSKHF